MGIYNRNYKGFYNYGTNLYPIPHTVTTFENSNIAWIVSVQMDYEEIEEPIKGAFINISLIYSIIIIILMSVFYTIFKMNKKREALELESKYLKKLNQAWQDLIKSETMLRHSQKLQTIGTLTSGIVHEFNNLLSPILGNSEIILGDLTQLQQVLINLYNNSQEHIFDHLFTTKDTGQGTGLGMAVVKEIIDKHNGKILINSELNIGTSVKIYIPVIEEKNLEVLNES